MTTSTNKQAKGFTIIEVVLVLAIAGLIFLMIFIALPALQRSQRDSQRRSDVGTFVTQLQQHATNNRGELPIADAAEDFAADYLKWEAGEGGEFNDPQTGKGYVLSKTGVQEPDEGGMVYGGKDTKCEGERIVGGDGNNRQAAVAVKLEGGGAFCQTVQ